MKGFLSILFTALLLFTGSPQVLAEGPNSVDREERARLMKLLSELDLPAVESYGSAPQSSVKTGPPPAPMTGLPVHQHDVEEETKN